MLTFGGYYESSDGVPESGGFPTYNDGTFVDVPRRDNWLTPWSEFSSDKKNAFINIEQDFSSGWKMSGNFNWTDASTSLVKGRVVQPIDPLNNFARRITNTHGDVNSTNKSFDVNVSGDGMVGGFNYGLLLGVDSHEFKYGYVLRTAAYAVSGIDVRGIDMERFARVSMPVFSQGDVVTKSQGAYGRIKISLLDDLHVILGGGIPTMRMTVGIGLSLE